MLSDTKTMYSTCLECWVRAVHIAIRSPESMIEKGNMIHYLNVRELLWNDFDKHIRSYGRDWVIFEKWLEFCEYFWRHHIQGINIFLFDIIRHYWIISWHDADILVQRWTEKKKSGH